MIMLHFLLCVLCGVCVGGGWGVCLCPCSGHIIGAKYHKVAPTVEATGDREGGASAWKPGMLWADLPAEGTPAPGLVGPSAVEST